MLPVVLEVSGKGRMCRAMLKTGHSEANACAHLTVLHVSCKPSVPQSPKYTDLSCILFLHLVEAIDLSRI